MRLSMGIRSFTFTHGYIAGRLSLTVAAFLIAISGTTLALPQRTVAAAPCWGNIISWNSGASYQYSKGEFCIAWNDEKVIFQSDGNFVGYRGTTVKWHSDTWHRGETIRFQVDGNIVIYDIKNKPVWHTGAYTSARNLYFRFAVYNG